MDIDIPDVHDSYDDVLDRIDDKNMRDSLELDKISHDSVDDGMVFPPPSRKVRCK